MLKRLYSKRSGFTLVEIIVAIAVFALMSTVIAGIMQMATMQRKKNLEYGEYLAQQEESLAMVVKTNESFGAAFSGDSDYKDGDYDMTFYETVSGTVDTTSSGYNVTMPYAVMDVDGGKTMEGINYFVSPVPYDGVYAGGGGTGGGQVGGGDEDATLYDGSLSSALCDARICASRGMDWVKILSVKKAGTPSSGAAVRYVIQTQANSDHMTDQGKAYAEYRLYFYMKDQIDPIRSKKPIIGYDASGKEFKYTQDIPLAADIVDVGYSDASGNPSSYINGKPTVRTTGANSVRIGVPFANEGGNLHTNDNFKGDGFNSSDIVTFYVDFKKDPELTVDSFGVGGLKNSTGGANGVGGVFQRCKVETVGDVYNNVFVYGGYTYPMHTITEGTTSD